MFTDDPDRSRKGSPKRLAWVNSPKLAPVKSHFGGVGSQSNLIVQGDNKTVLETLRPGLVGQVRCIYLDPPYNNRESYSHYEDNESHDVWLSSMVSCAESLKDFLSETGSIWISIDDREVHYLKVALDRVFGRENFITTIVWQQRTTRENRKVFSNDHEYILVYAKNFSKFKLTRGLLPWTDEVLQRYKNPDNDPRGLWQSVSANAQGGHATKSQFYELIAPNGRRHNPPNGRCWIFDKKRMTAEILNNNIWFGHDGNGVPRVKRFLTDAKRGLTPHTLWLADEVDTNDLAKKHLLSLLPKDVVFDTPKPERLIQRILEIATAPEDLVLDAYLGSGTTAAVAQKMGRRYVGIEMGDHIVTHCVERLRKVIAGEQGGISQSVGWTGGGGYEFFKLKASA
jgi:adenine-specific DNA-methyltransferase